jgi:Mg-chelatase subunit ChlI
VLFPVSKVEIVKRYLSDAEFVQVKVPMSLTPTQAANQLRETLIEHYQAIDHVPKPKRTYALTVDAEIKVSAFRAYLVTYDAQVKLAEQYKDGVVPAKELLNEVRKYYLARSHRWRNTKRKVEALPPALASGEYVYDHATNTVSAKDRYDSGAIRTVRMYLKKANSLILASASGDFPGKSYYK